MSPGARQGATRDVCDVGYVAYKPYQYIDLSADEAVAKRRWPSSASRDSNGHGGAGTISRDYVYIDRGAIQLYLFLLHLELVQQGMLPCLARTWCVGKDLAPHPEP